ncbi:MAG: M42 family metallopeptidase [Clostridia bacterium]|nr:M42 family metallopeptidase [Clostridia bacterium]
MQYITQQFEKLVNIDSPSGFTDNVARYTMQQFIDMGYKSSLTTKGCVVVDLGGEGNPIVLSAHIDTLGAMVAEIKGNGGLRLTRIGGLQPQNIEAENCTVYTREGNCYTGCMQLCNASTHVNADYAKSSREFTNMEVLLDEVVSSRLDVEKLGIAVGDYVCFCPRTVITPSGYIKSRFIDDKMSVAILLGFAKYIADNNIVPSRRIYAYITVYEEVGHGCASFPFDAREILCVDMGCVGDGLTCDERKVSICAKDSTGPYNYEMTTRLINCAKQHNLAYAVDVYPYYGSDASAALSAGADIKSALIGTGVYASHGYERTHIQGITNTFELLKHFLLP